MIEKHQINWYPQEETIVGSIGDTVSTHLIDIHICRTGYETNHCDERRHEIGEQLDYDVIDTEPYVLLEVEDDYYNMVFRTKEELQLAIDTLTEAKNKAWPNE